MVFAKWGEETAITRSQDVAEAVWRAATDPSCPMRLPAGADAVALAGGALKECPQSRGDTVRRAQRGRPGTVNFSSRFVGGTN